MKNAAKLFAVISVLAMLGACTTVPKAPIEPHPDTPAYDWKPLFANDLSDAEFEKGAWVWEGNVLRSVLDKPIWTKADWENYVLDFEYMMEKDGNSGVFIYISNLDKYPKDKVLKYKIEVQLLDDDSPKFKGKELAYQQSGSLYGRATAKVAAVTKDPAWCWRNNLTIWAKGKRIRVLLNGVEVQNANLDDFTSVNNPDGTVVPPWQRSQPPWCSIPTKGRIGLQGNHGKSSWFVWYARIRPLTNADAF